MLASALLLLLALPMIAAAASRNDFAYHTAPTPDGGVVAAGYTCGSGVVPCDFAVAKYLADGSLDPSFGSGGKVRTDVDPSGNDLAYGLDVRPTGEVVVSGQSQPGGSAEGGRIAIAQYRPDGRLDPSFGNAGIVLANPPCKGLTHWGPHGGWTSALQPDGKLVVAFPGYHCDGSGQADNLDFVIERYDTTGHLDTNFGEGGLQRIDFSAGSYNSDLPYAVVVNPDDGAITIVGQKDDGSPGNRPNADSDLAAARLTSTGQMDTGFGSGGKLLFPYSSPAADEGSNEFFLRAGLDPQHRVVAVGVCVEGRCSDWQRLLTRFDAHGVDPNFAGGQDVVVGGGLGLVEGLIVQGTGKVLLAGTCDGTAPECQSSRTGIQRLESNGQPDTAFGTGSWKSIAAMGSFGVRNVEDVGALPGGGVATAGSCGCDNATGFDFLVGKLNDAAEPDTSFGGDGFVTTDFGDLPAGDQIDYVALGDSVAAGEGIGYGFEWSGDHWTRNGNTETWDTQFRARECHQTAQAAARGVALALHRRLTHLACTGASALHGLLGKQGDLDAQLGQRFIDAAPDVVSLSLGANDIDFAAEVKLCYSADRHVSCDTPQEEQKLTANLNDQKSNLVQVLDRIRELAKQSTGRLPLVFVTRYPDPYPDDWKPECIDVHTVGLGYGGISNGEFRFLKDGLRRLNANLDEAVKGRGEVHVVAPPPDFREHTFCSLKGPWVFGPSINVPTFLGGFGDTAAPFHPTAAGQAAIKDNLVYAMSNTDPLEVGHDVSSQTDNGTKVTVQNVATPGSLGITPLDPQQIPPTRQFALQGQPVDIFTSSEYSGDITVSLPSSSPATLYHYTGGAWQEVPSTFANGAVTGTVQSLSPFALGTPVTPVAAQFTHGSAGAAPADVSFDAGTSTGPIAHYEWDFGDGSTSGSVTPAHRFAVSGSYSVTLRVTSSQGAVDETSQTVTVSNAPPLASLTGPTEATAGEPATFDSTGSSDPNGSLTSTEWSFEDDGSVATTHAVTHTFQAAGSYTVRLTVFDDELAPTTETRIVKVIERGPPPGDGGTPLPDGGSQGDQPGTGALPLIRGLVAPTRVAYGRARKKGVRLRLRANTAVGIVATLTAPASSKGGRARRISRASLVQPARGVVHMTLRLVKLKAKQLFGHRRHLPLALRITGRAGTTATILTRTVVLDR